MMSPGGLAATLAALPVRIASVRVQTNAVALDIRAFVADVVAVARGWLNANVDDPVVKRNLEASVRLHPTGLHPFIVGVPVVG